MAGKLRVETNKGETEDEREHKEDARERAEVR